MTSHSASAKAQDSSHSKFKAWRFANPWKSRLLFVFLTLFVLITIIRIALAPSIIYGATNWLKEQGIDSTIEDINFNFISGNISLVDASGYVDDELLFNIDLIEIHWRWTPLSEKKVVINKVELDNLNVNIEMYTDQMIIGGVSIPVTEESNTSQEETETKSDANTKPWAAALGEVVFSNLNLCFMQDTGPMEKADKSTRYIDYCVFLDEMKWGGTIAYATDPELLESDDIAITSTGDFEIDGLTVMDNILEKQLLRSSSNILDNVQISGLNSIHIDELSMNNLSALQRDDDDHADTVRFKNLELIDINFDSLNSMTIQSLSLENTGLYIVKSGKDEWEYAQWIPKDNTSPKDTVSAQEQTEVKPSTFSFSINDITVNESDFCYLEKENNLYNCFFQDSLEWKGSIKTVTGDKEPQISIKGGLVASNTSINNPDLNRDLLTIKSISLDNLIVAAIDKVNFDNFTINQLNALQRGKEKSDSTAAFDKLLVNKLAYTGDAVSINQIKLVNVSNIVSKNKDGSWEHDKWLTANENNKEKTGKKAAEQKNKKSNTASTDKDKLKFSINDIQVTTSKEMLYIDNSTDPVMKIGLNQLDFNIKDLDANKPEAKSPIMLSAKSIRHGTIDINGTVSPLSDKLSMDAKGKLKGFDLRAASPASKQAIGHIIKSGQLDADLKLLAKKGVLDSNIGLSLYQFNIKSESKEAAAKLDKEFGMPLNQTLVLLRDKDDSIHLDIPITGDVENPDFDPMDAIVKATTKAATVTLITFYTPYGLAYAGGNVLFDLATALNFDPIEFQPGQSKLSEDNKKKLQNLSKLMTEKPQIHLTLCGITNNSDIYALYPDKKPSSDAKDKEIKLSKEQIAAVRKVANDRQENSKNYLIKSTKINHDRIILCEPEHNKSEDAITGVEITI